MKSRPASPARRTRSPRSERRSSVITTAVYFLVAAVILGVVIPISQQLPLIAGGVFAVLALVALVAAAGPERASWHLMVLAFFLAPLTNLTLAYRPFVLASLVFCASFALALPRLSRVPLRLPGFYLVGAVLFTVMGVLATVVAEGALYSLVWIFLSSLTFILIPVAIVWMRPTDGQIYALMAAFAMGAAASTLYGIVPGYTYRNPGFTYHPVALAYTCMLALSFMPFMVAHKPARHRWLLVGPLAALALAGIWTSGSRTGVVVLAALVVVVPVIERSVKLGLLVIAAIVVALPVVLSVDPDQNSTSALARLLGGGGATASDGTRESTLEMAFDQIRESPLVGNGYSIEHTYTIHNLYLQVLAAEGVVGFIGMLMMLAVFVSGVRKAEGIRRSLAYPALAAVLAGPFQPNMSDHYLGMALGLSLVAAVGVMGERQQAALPDLSEDPVPQLSRASSTIS